MDPFIVAALICCSVLDLDSDAVSALKKAPHVAEVRVVKAKAPLKHRIIHICDWHHVPKVDFEADLKDQNESLTQDELDAHYAQHLKDVEQVQREQTELLQHLIAGHKLNAVHIEGLTAEDSPIFEAVIRALRKQNPQARDGETLLRFGAAGRLYAEGRLAKVLPAEVDKSLGDANPVRGADTVDVERAAHDARHEAIIRALRGGLEVSVLVLGAAHDLSDSVPDDTEYIRLTTKHVVRMEAD